MFRPSIFDIPTKPTHLKSGNEGTANAHYRQVSATKDVTGKAFYQGVQQFRLETSGNTWFVPSKSYFRLRCQLLQARGAGEELRPVLSNSEMAPAMGLAANLFKSAEVQLNGQTLERITERLPQIDALKTRMQNTGSWCDQVGSTTNFWSPDFAARREQVSVDGYLPKSPGNEPAYGPWLTQPQAHFDVQHRLQYAAATKLVTFDANGQGAIDVQHGVMSLRPGDRLRHGDTVLQVLQIIDATHALVECEGSGVNGNQDVNQPGAGDDAPPVGVNGWLIQKLSSATNNVARGQDSFELIWRPPLGFFDIEHAIPPGGSWVIEFNPANVTEAQKNVVESLGNDLPCVLDPDGAAPNPNRSFHFAVQEFFFFTYTLESNRFDQGKWLLDLRHTRCQHQTMPAHANNLIQKSFDVPGKTTALTLAFQDQGPSSDTRYSQSKFKIRPAPPDDQGNQSTEEGQDLLLERFFLQYGEEQKPVPDFDGAYTQVQANSHEHSKDHLKQRYVDSLMQADLYHTDGGAESYDDWLRRGPYYHFRWPKDAMNQGTRVVVNFKFSQPFAEDLEHQVMLFNHWRTAYQIEHRNGRVDTTKLQEL